MNHQKIAVAGAGYIGLAHIDRLRGFLAEDIVAIGMRFTDGALGSFFLFDTAGCARSWEQASQENKEYPSYDDEDCYTIAGTFGSLSVPTMRLKTYGNAEDRSWWKPFDTSVVAIPRDARLARQIEHFAAVIRGEVKPIVSARYSCDNLRITNAIVESSRTGLAFNTAH